MVDQHERTEDQCLQSSLLNHMLDDQSQIVRLRQLKEIGSLEEEFCPF